MRGEEAGHLRIEIDERYALAARVLENLANGQPVAAAEDEHVARTGQGGEPRMHERLVIAVLVARTELQVGVEKEPQVVLPCGEHDVLVPRVTRKDDIVGVDVVLGERRYALRLGQSKGEESQHPKARHS